MWNRFRAVGKNRIILFCIVTAAVILTGCTWFSEPQRKHYYQIYYKPKGEFRTREGLVARVKTFDIDQVYKRYNIVYRNSRYEMFYYNYHFWATRPAELITDAVLRHVKDTGMFQEVIIELEKKPDYVITGRILALDKIDSGDRWFARASIEFVLRDFKTEKVIVSHYFERRKEVFNKQPVYIVRALSSLIEQETTVFLKKVDEKI